MGISYSCMFHIMILFGLGVIYFRLGLILFGLRLILFGLRVILVGHWWTNYQIWKQHRHRIPYGGCLWKVDKYIRKKVIPDNPEPTLSEGSLGGHVPPSLEKNLTPLYLLEKGDIGGVKFFWRRENEPTPLKKWAPDCPGRPGLPGKNYIFISKMLAYHAN